MPMMVGMMVRTMAVMTSDDHENAQRVLYVNISSAVKLVRRSTILITGASVCVLRCIGGYASYDEFSLDSTTWV